MEPKPRPIVRQGGPITVRVEVESLDGKRLSGDEALRKLSELTGWRKEDQHNNSAQ